MISEFTFKGRTALILAYLVLLIVAVFSCDDIDNFYEGDINICQDTVVVVDTFYHPPRNYCVAVFFDIDVSEGGLVTLDAYPDSMQYLMTHRWELRQRSTGHTIDLANWDLEKQLPYVNGVWEVRLYVEYEGTSENIGCGALIYRTVNPVTGFVGRVRVIKL